MGARVEGGHGLKGSGLRHMCICGSTGGSSGPRGGGHGAAKWKEGDRETGQEYGREMKRQGLRQLGHLCIDAADRSCRLRGRQVHLSKRVGEEGGGGRKVSEAGRWSVDEW